MILKNNQKLKLSPQAMQRRNLEYKVYILEGILNESMYKMQFCVINVINFQNEHKKLKTQ